MKPFAYALFALCALVMVGLFAIGIYSTMSWEDEDPPKVAARKAECRKLERHLFEISPDSAGRNIDELVAKVPIEDIEQCGAAYPESVACMQAAAASVKGATFVEIGPGSVLSGLLKRIVPDAPTVTLGTAGEVERFLA